MKNKNTHIITGDLDIYSPCFIARYMTRIKSIRENVLRKKRLGMTNAESNLTEKASITPKRRKRNII